jgi:hypothetical protein
MVLATLCFVIVHPGPVVVMKMPSVFGGLKGRLGMKRWPRGNRSLAKPMDSPGGYMELENDARGYESRR